MSPSDGRARRVLHNTLFLYGSETAARLFSWAMLAFLTRRWSEVGTYGQYAIAVNWAAILGVFSELGLNVLVVREVAHQRDRALFYLRNAIFIRFFFSVVCFGCLLAVSFFLGYEPVLVAAMAVIGIRILVDSIASGYIYMFQSHEMMGYYSLVNVLSSAVRLAGIVGVVEMGGGVVEACAVWTVASSIALVALVWKGWKLGWRPDFSKFQMRDISPILRQSIPLATFGAFQMLYYRVDSVILKSLSGNEAVGYYDLAAKLVFVVLAFSQIFGTAVFPALSSLRDDSKAFGRMAGRAFKFLLLLGLPATVGGWFLSKPLVLLVSGIKYQPSVPMFAVLMLSVIPYFLSHVYVITLAIHNSLRLNFQFATLFLLNAVLNFILIPRMGGMGSAWATTGCEFFGLALGFGIAAPYLRNLSWTRLFRPLAACLGASALMGFCIQLDPRLYWLALGPVVYGSTFWFLGGLDPEDLANIRSALKRRTA